METLVVIASIRRLDNIVEYIENFQTFGHDFSIIVIDEAAPKDIALRSYNHSLLDKLLDAEDYAFFGLKERREWMKSHGVLKEDFIPLRCHAETSFGFLFAWALRDKYDMILEIDDDTCPAYLDVDFIKLHWRALCEGADRVIKGNPWVNPILGGGYIEEFPRGFPYSQRKSFFQQLFGDTSQKPSKLNQGLWCGALDLDALDLVSKGEMDGRFLVQRKEMDYYMKDSPSFRVGDGSLTTVCSMNAAFVPDIIPAFYQLYMNIPTYIGVLDRFDDIWSGLFLKKILDIRGESMTFGAPFCYHDKAPRDVFKDFQAELPGILLNEDLWKIVQSFNSDADDYIALYRQLTDHIDASKTDIQAGKFIDFIEKQCKYMHLWSDAMEDLE